MRIDVVAPLQGQMTPLSVCKDIICWFINSNSPKPKREFEDFDCARHVLAYVGAAAGQFEISCRARAACYGRAMANNLWYNPTTTITDQRQCIQLRIFDTWQSFMTLGNLLSPSVHIILSQFKVNEVMVCTWTTRHVFKTSLTIVQNVGQQDLCKTGNCCWRFH